MDISNTWKNKAYFIPSNKSKSGFVVISFETLSNNHSVSKVFMSDNKGVVIDWNPIEEVRDKDNTEYYIKKYSIRKPKKTHIDVKLVDTLKKIPKEV